MADRPNGFSPVYMLQHQYRYNQFEAWRQLAVLHVIESRFEAYLLEVGNPRCQPP
jgi:hypothetical protein